jgi:membrane protease YdiL (CAAX protease family)
MNRITSFTKQYPVAAFFILTFILSWGVGLLTDAVWEATQSIPLTLPLLILSLAPLSAVLIVSGLTGGKGAILVLLRKLTIWRVSWRWYLLALFLQPALNLVAIYLNVILGAPAPTVAAFGTLPALMGTFALRLINPLDGPMLEELGWRGFAQPLLQERFSPLTANLILAALVTLWHLRLIPTGDYAWIYIPATMAVTLIYGWVYNATGGSVLLTLIMHAVEPLIWVSFPGADDARAVSLRVAIYAITAVIVVISTGKNLGRKVTPTTQANLENVVVPV